MSKRKKNREPDPAALRAISREAAEREAAAEHDVAGNIYDGRGKIQMRPIHEKSDREREALERLRRLNQQEW